MTFHRPLITVAALLATTAQGQSRHDTPMQISSVTVHVDLPANHSCSTNTEVTLLSASGIRVADGYTNGQCVVSFPNLVPGSYRVVVSATGTEHGDASFNLASGFSEDVDVPVKAEGGQQDPTYSRMPLVSTTDLRIPDAARKEFDKATDSMAKENWKQASERLKKAIDIYPQYAQAYNNLGVVYSRLGNRIEEREALQKAVESNDHFAPPLVNLARMAIADRDMITAETLLNRATAIDPQDTMTLVLLSNVELLTRHFNEALETSRRAHSHSKDPHALVHMVAARVYEAHDQKAEAAAELRTFLSEEPAGERAEAVRKEMASLNSSR